MHLVQLGIGDACSVYAGDPTAPSLELTQRLQEESVILSIDGDGDDADMLDADALFKGEQVIETGFFGVVGTIILKREIFLRI
jgi:hypothetical protein